MVLVAGIENGRFLSYSLRCYWMEMSVELYVQCYLRIFSVKQFYIINYFLFKNSCYSFHSAMYIFIYNDLVLQARGCGQSQREGRVDPTVAGAMLSKYFPGIEETQVSINVSGNSCYYH